MGEAEADEGLHGLNGVRLGCTPAWSPLHRQLSAQSQRVERSEPKNRLLTFWVWHGAALPLPVY